MTSTPERPDWISTGDIAAMVGLTLHHVTNHITKLPAFPKPVVNLNGKMRRWDRAAVLAYFTGRKRRV